MFFETRTGRDLPFLAQWREIGADGKKSKRVAQSFADKSSRDAFVHVWINKRTERGKHVSLSVPVSKMQVWEKFDEITGGANPIEVATFWIRNHGGEAGQNMTLNQVIEKYPSTRSKPMSSSMTLHLERLNKVLGNRRFTSITPEDLRAWLKGLAPKRLKGRPPSPITVRTHCKSLRTLWSAAIIQQWASYNTAAAVAFPHVSGEGDDVNILTVGEARRLFAANRNALCVGRLALEAFGGLRYTSAARIAKDDVLIAEKGIVMPGRKHKSGRRHFVSGWPANLWKWIQHARPECWEISERTYLDLKRAAFVRAGLKPEVRSKKEEGGSNGAQATRDVEAAVLASRKNALRHSFASYHLAAFKDQGLTAYLMTKTSISSLNNDYRGRATEKDAKAYFAIAP